MDSSVNSRLFWRLGLYHPAVWPLWPQDTWKVTSPNSDVLVGFEDFVAKSVKYLINNFIFMTC